MQSHFEIEYAEFLGVQRLSLKVQTVNLVRDGFKI